MSDEPTPQPPRNVVEAIVAVMRDVRAVGKDGTNQQQGYKFRGYDGTINALGPAMRKHGLIATPILMTKTHQEIVVGQKGTKQGHVQVEVTYRFRYSNAAGDLSELDVVVPGESMDSGDKATAKAMTVAFRIALLQTFALPTEEADPDEDTYERTPAVDPRELEQAVRDAVHAPEPINALKAVWDHYGTDRLEDVQVTGPNGARVSGAELINGFVQEIRAREVAAQERREALASQDAAEQPQAQPPAATPQAPAGRPQAPAQPAASNPFIAAVLAEIDVQAQVLGVTPEKHAAPILKQLMVKDRTGLTQAHLRDLGGWTVKQRARVLLAGRERGYPGDVLSAYADSPKDKAASPDVLNRLMDAGAPATVEDVAATAAGR